MEEEIELLNITIKTPSYDELDDILFNILAAPHFIWITGKRGIGKTHCLHYVEQKTVKIRNFFTIYIDMMNSSNIIIDIKNAIYNRLKFFNNINDPNSIKTNDFLSLSKKIKSKQKNINFILLLDGLDINITGFKTLFRVQNQRFFEDLINCGYYFIISTSPGLERELDNYFSGKVIILRPFSSIGEIKQMLEAINKSSKNGTIGITPAMCIHLLETTKGLPSDIVSRGKKLIEESKNLENIHNSFIVNHLKEIDNICEKFRIDGFRDRLIAWLHLFPNAKDKQLALKLANYVKYYDSDAIRRKLKEGYETILKSLEIQDEWSEIIVCGPGGPGKSGEYLLYRLKHIAKLHEKQCCHIEELYNKINIKTKAIIFVDDFIGTGEQNIQLWNNIKDFIYDIKVYLLVICGVESSIQHLKEQTSFQVVCGDVLSDDKNILSERNIDFTDEEKKRIVEICESIDKKMPLGFGHCGLCIAFEHTTPNNTIAIIRADTSEFQGLFPRRGL